MYQTLCSLALAECKGKPFFPTMAKTRRASYTPAAFPQPDTGGSGNVRE